MRYEIKKAISSAIVKLLRPLVTILLRNNIPYGTFAELAKWVYVDAASKEFGIKGRKQSASRVSILTGLSRKEVKRIKDIREPDDLGATERYNRAGRVISGWLKDGRFLSDDGSPMALALEGEKVSFSALVKDYSGDIPVRALLDEMLNTQGVIELKDGRIKLLSKGYIVKKGDVEKLGILGRDVSELILTINHNLVCDQQELFLQRKTSYDNIPEDALCEVKTLISQKGAEFVESMDKLISKYDKDANPVVNGKGRKRAGLGIFYFE